jgi:hypothetical protein
LISRMRSLATLLSRKRQSQSLIPNPYWNTAVSTVAIRFQKACMMMVV